MKCPECPIELRDPNRCPCGWEKEAEKETTKCSYMDGGKKCPLNGQSSDGTTNGQWWCSFHFYCRYGKEARDILDDILKNPPPNKLDWHDEIIATAGSEGIEAAFKKHTKPVEPEKEIEHEVDRVLEILVDAVEEIMPLSEDDLTIDDCIV